VYTGTKPAGTPSYTPGKPGDGGKDGSGGIVGEGPKGTAGEMYEAAK
jgi:hypothetical protein